MQGALPLIRDLVLVGGGHSHALLLRMWGMNPLPGVRLTLMNPGPTAPYSGMLPGHIAGHYRLEQLDIDLVRLARFAGARFVPAPVFGIDLQRKLVRAQGWPEIRYDVVSIDVGITTSLPDLPGFVAHAVAAKPLDRFVAAWEDWLARLTSGTVAPQINIIGAGVAGVELALAMQHRVAARGVRPEITLLDAAEALGAVAPGTRTRLRAMLTRRGIGLIEHCALREVTAEGVVLDDGRLIPSSFVLGAAGARPHDWIGRLGLDSHEGYICVDEHLRSTSDPAVFASGDCAHLGFAPRPKAGVYAVRAAPILFANLRAELAGTRPRRFRPQKDYLKLISLGGKSALADKGGRSLSLPGLWLWKDRIDRRFMDKFRALPAMAEPALPSPRARGIEAVLGDTPLCGGCGAKLAGASLKFALDRLPPPLRADVLTRPGDDAAVLRIGGETQVLTTDHLRAFTEDPVTFARIAAVHALGDIWAMGASPQAALAQIILPRMAEQMQAATLREILDTATEVFRAEGADLVGGHTSIGAELTLGFTLTGLAAAAPITLGGARPGDVLLLTKPIGSGTILAGEMQGKARGADVLAALAAMRRPQGDAAAVLTGARAMTDVTGFGLAGHLMAICDASGTGAELELDAIPFYDGAEALAAGGIRSTLYPANRAVAARMTLPEGPRADLLFDPQTAGGLLAAVAPETAEDRLERLRALGFAAARIGRIVDGPPFVTIL
ncbi:selenide, water dikinase SelD [Tropicimonas sp. IMCC34043]|uniref:selenide, water dikinase SelD n=1 Tax=Tropicimonas sp. IMCC34043 TaxID=2248760 RepID=UPI000E27595F|nr:selenide, water dikinase SelD [Tropicimonas sp. IMCC34043]